VSPAGDFDGDAVADVTLSLPARVLSGLDGATLLTLPGYDFAHGIGDVSGDGIPDLLVSISGPAAVPRPFDVVFGPTGQHGYSLGMSRWGQVLDDVNGDGRRDILLHDSVQYFLHDGATGNLIHAFPSSVLSIKRAGDFNGDGVNDHIVDNVVISGYNGPPIPLPNLFGPLNQSTFGETIGDINGDGYDDLTLVSLVGHWWEPPPDYRMVIVFGPTGSWVAFTEWEASASRWADWATSTAMATMNGCSASRTTRR
jgi:hypothetical protein